AAHLSEPERAAVHPLRHVVAADARIGAHALRHHGRRVVRAARAEIRDTRGDLARLRQPRLSLLQPRNAPRDRLVVATCQQALPDADGDVIGIERALDREQPVAALVLLADAHRLVGGAIELLAHLHFDERALLLDDDDEIEPLGEFLQLTLAQRPRAG